MIDIKYDADAETPVIDSIAGEGRWFLELLDEDEVCLVVQDGEDEKRIFIELAYRTIDLIPLPIPHVKLRVED